MAQHLEGDPDYVLAEERRDEAEKAAACADRFVAGEMDPTGSLTVARGQRVGPLGAPPSLAEKLGQRLDRANEDLSRAVGLAVHKALAVGYLSVVESEQRGGIKVHPDRNDQDLWEFWMTECRTMLEDTGIPKDWAQMVRGMGADLLVSELKKLKLVRLLGSSKVNQLGLLYAQAGAHLRFGQTDNTPDDVFQERVRLRREMPERPWRLDEDTREARRHQRVARHGLGPA
jgi:hypothetical protein